MHAELTAGTPRQFSYDHELYDRQFMSCLYRHAVVWLERLGCPVQLLFHNALASTDQVLAQILVERRPRFAFRCAAFSDADFELIGAREVSVMAETFREIRAQVLERVQAGEFALIEGNVYYLPHCPEYRRINNQHVVVVHGIEQDGRWAVVDDDAASILCGYTYEEGYLARFFENSVNRKLRYYTLDASFNSAEAKALVELKFRVFAQQYQDSHKFFASVDAFLQSPFDTLESKHHLLHDAFALLSGSRQCFASYLRLRGSQASLVEATIACAKSASTIKMILARAKLVGVLSTSDLLERVEQLRRREVGLMQLLQGQVRCS